MKKDKFSRGVEKLVDPITVGSIHFIQQFNQLLPKFIQANLIKSSAVKIPYMGFVVEPYSFFLCYEIADLEKAKSLLPDGFRLIKTSIFTDDAPKYYGLFGCFRSHTSAFWGARIEFYIIAEDEKTGLLSWVIVDYDTDTISYDSGHGLRAPGAPRSVMTTNYSGQLIVDMKRTDNERQIDFEVDLNDGKTRPLDKRLWLEGNLSVAYGKVLSENNADVFSLKFNPEEVEEAQEISLDKLYLEKNNWYPGLLKSEPAKLACFPYAQHFVSDSPGHASNIKNEEELAKAINEIDFDNISVFSAKPFKFAMIASGLISFLITITLLALYIFK